MSYRAGRGERAPKTLSPDELEAWRRRSARERARVQSVHAPRILLLTIAVVLVIWLAYLLSAALLAVGSQIPGLTVDTASAATPLGCAIPSCASTTPQDFEYSAPANTWTVVGVRSSTGAGNANVCTYRDAALTQQLGCSSLAANTAVDFVAVDYHHTPAGTLDYVRAERVSGSGALCTTYDCGTSIVVANGASLNATWPANQVVRAFNLVAGQAGTYRAAAIVTGGTADLGVAVFHSNGQANYAAGRSGALAEADVHGAGLSEGLYFAAAAGDTFGLVVWSNTAAGTANYRVEFRSVEVRAPNVASDEGGEAVADFLYVPTVPRGWSVLSLRPAFASPAPDADLKIYTRPDYFDQLDRSSAEPGVVDFIVANYANAPEDTAAVLVVSLGPIGSYKLDWVYDPPTLLDGDVAAVSLSGRVSSAWTMNLVGGLEYLFRFEPTGGTRGDASFGLYGPTLAAPSFTYGTRADSLAGSDVWGESATGWTGDLGIETFTYTPQVSGEFLVHVYQKRTQTVAGTFKAYPTSLIGVPDPGAGRASFATPWPSPSRAGQTVRFAFEMPGAGSARLVVLDARGRVVRTLVDGPLAAGAAVYAWDGRRNDGTRTAAGLYFARLERAGVAVESRRFVRVD
jgi:hypothetical protein